MGKVNYQKSFSLHISMANTHGGYIILDVKEKDNSFFPVGINNVAK